MTAKAILGNAGKQVNGTSIAPVPSAQIIPEKPKERRLMVSHL
jgi:hypothetical protein